jgi:hypothetical protein
MTDLAQFSVGTVVTMNRNFQLDGFDLSRVVNGTTYHSSDGSWVEGIPDIGHVARFGRDGIGGITIVVDWSTGDRTSVHPANLQVVTSIVPEYPSTWCHLGVGSV